MDMLDHAVITLHAGKGGDGRVSFLRQKYRPKGGPDGGDGGHGGSVYVVGDSNLNTLRQFHAKRHYKAEPGEMGGKNKQHGRNGDHCTVSVPVGTTLYCMEYDPEAQIEYGLRYRPKEEVKKIEIVEEGVPVRVCRGGRGGQGNTAFKSSTNQAPQEFEPGGKAEEFVVYLELQVLADVGFVGQPNAGKSSLLASITRARPEIASYPFTTITPNLGVMTEEASQRSAVVADIPGLILGASAGKGLGHAFLRHLERCTVIVYVLGIDIMLYEDVAEADDKKGQAKAMGPVIENLETVFQELEQELREYERQFPEAEFRKKKRMLVINKIDLFSKETFSIFSSLCKKSKILPKDYVFTSAVTGDGIPKLRSRILDII